MFGIGYDDDMLTAKQIMEDILQAHDLVLTDPEPAVAVAELADSSVNFNVRPWVKSEDYWGVRSDLMEKIKLAFDKMVFLYLILKWMFIPINKID